MPIHPSRRRVLSICIASLAVLALGGCGDESLDRYPVKGTVTYDGKPVESGLIFFEPTASAGKIAPTVYLDVRDGRFDAGDEGPVKGKYRVVVGGYDKSRERVDDDGVTHTELLFPEFRFEVDIPPPNNTLDVEVPVRSSAQEVN